jgi:hypothetical protein
MHLPGQNSLSSSGVMNMPASPVFEEKVGGAGDFLLKTGHALNVRALRRFWRPDCFEAFALMNNLRRSDERCDYAF